MVLSKGGKVLHIFYILGGEKSKGKFEMGEIRYMIIIAKQSLYLRPSVFDFQSKNSKQNITEPISHLQQRNFYLTKA
jgi:hypothetical protein